MSARRSTGPSKREIENAKSSSASSSNTAAGHSPGTVADLQDDRFDSDSDEASASPSRDGSASEASASQSSAGSSSSSAAYTDSEDEEMQRLFQAALDAEQTKGGSTFAAGLGTSEDLVRLDAGARKGKGSWHGSVDLAQQAVRK